MSAGENDTHGVSPCFHVIKNNTKLINEFSVEICSVGMSSCGPCNDRLPYPHFTTPISNVQIYNTFTHRNICLWSHTYLQFTYNTITSHLHTDTHAAYMEHIFHVLPAHSGGLTHTHMHCKFAENFIQQNGNNRSRRDSSIQRISPS